MRFITCSKCSGYRSYMKEIIIPCKTCGGKGYFIVKDEQIICGICEGKGTVSTWEQVTCEECKGKGGKYI